MPKLLGVTCRLRAVSTRRWERAHAAGCQCVQIFLKNNSQWRAAEIENGQVERFQASLTEHRITHPLAHASYLINLASPDAALRRSPSKVLSSNCAEPNGFASLIW